MIAALALRHWKLLLGGLAIVLLLGSTTYYRIDRDHWRKIAGVLRIDLEQVRQLRKQDRANYENAQAAAQALAEAEKAKDAAQYQTIAERTDNAQEAAQRRAAANRYAVAHRVRKGTTTAPSAAGGASGASAGSVAASDNDSRGDAVLVERRDFDQLVTNTIRLKAAHDWGNSLIDAGLAVKAD